MYPLLVTYCNQLTASFQSIPSERKAVLDKIVAFIAAKKNQDLPVNLVFICTHNARRSHFGQVWAKLAAVYYNVSNVATFSAGTEATEFHLHARNALLRAGFEITKLGPARNPIFSVAYDDLEIPMHCFSKTTEDASIPISNFLAVMTCSDAEQNCPYLPGAEARIATTYEDPKVADHTSNQNKIYDERCEQIARELFYVFSQLKVK